MQSPAVPASGTPPPDGGPGDRRSRPICPSIARRTRTNRSGWAGSCLPFAWPRTGQCRNDGTQPRAAPNRGKTGPFRILLQWERPPSRVLLRAGPV